MKKALALFALVGALFFGGATLTYAQDPTEDPATEQTTEEGATEETAPAEEPAPAPAPAEEPVEEVNPMEMDVNANKTFHQIVKEKFIEGDWRFMSFVLVCLILGLGLAIERIIMLNLASTNTKKLIQGVEDALNSGGTDKAIEYTKAQRGPVASIFTQGLMSAKSGVEMVEKTVMAYGSVEMGRLERNLVWISLFIALAPMLGFMGTVIGMIGAFDAIEAAGDISPSLVAGGIKVALLTTVAGLIVAIILQLFYNYCVSKVDSLVNQMEDASISLVDILLRHENKGK